MNNLYRRFSFSWLELTGVLGMVAILGYVGAVYSGDISITTDHWVGAVLVLILMIITAMVALLAIGTWISIQRIQSKAEEAERMRGEMQKMRDEMRQLVESAAELEQKSGINKEGGAGVDQGIFTQLVQMLKLPPRILGVNPIEGKSSQDVQFRAIIQGSIPMSCYWSFGGGATPNTASIENPRVQLGPPGKYRAALVVRNAYGDNAYPFILEVNPKY